MWKCLCTSQGRLLVAQEWMKIALNWRMSNFARFYSSIYFNGIFSSICCPCWDMTGSERIEKIPTNPFSRRALALSFLFMLEQMHSTYCLTRLSQEELIEVFSYVYFISSQVDGMDYLFNGFVVAAYLKICCLDSSLDAERSAGSWWSQRLNRYFWGLLRIFCPFASVNTCLLSFTSIPSDLSSSTTLIPSASGSTDLAGWLKRLFDFPYWLLEFYCQTPLVAAYQNPKNSARRMVIEMILLLVRHKLVMCSSPSSSRVVADESILLVCHQL